MKTILEKINKADEIQAKKVELGKHEVELGTIDDIKKLISVYTNKISKDYSTIYAEHTDLYNKVKELQSKSKVAYELYNKSYAEFSKAQQTLKKQAADLGLDVSKIKEYTELVQLVDDNSRAYKTYELIAGIKLM